MSLIHDLVKLTHVYSKKVLEVCDTELRKEALGL